MNKIKFILKSFVDLFLYIFYSLIFHLEGKKEINNWLISERGFDAKDNGYFFYLYMKKYHPEISVKYVIDTNSSDSKKIDRNDIVEYRSKEHYYYFLYSKYLISAQIMGMSPNEQLYYRLNKYNLLKVKGKTVFLQHGITKDYNSYMDPQNTKLDLFICGAKPEYEYMVNKYGYSIQNAKLTGFARFDNLTSTNEKIILIMPTWRTWLKYSDSIINTEFYDNYMKILNDKDIISMLEKNKYKMIFYPHIVLQKFVHEFISTSNNVIIADFDNYDVQDLLIRSKLLITDYSSVAFDFAYMRKKTIYYQFDLEKYRKEQYAEGYYNYEKDGFGPSVYNYMELKKYIINYLSDEKSLDNYNNRIENFFEYSDYKNCERIYKEIIKK